MISNRRRFPLRLNVLLVAVCAGSARADGPVTVFASGATQSWVAALAAEFEKTHPPVQCQVIGDDTKSGIEELLQGRIAAAVLARPPSSEEISRGRQFYKKQLVGYPVAGDAVILFVRPDNPAKSMTLEQVKDVFTLRIQEWPALGVAMEESADEKALRLHVHPKSQGPPINRHSMADRFDSVQALVLKITGRWFVTEGRRTYDNRRDLIHAVAADRFGIGFAGRGDLQGVATLAVQLDDASPSVSPSPETIRDRSYPLAHYQYLYVTGQPEGRVKAFLAFILSEPGQRMIEQLDTGAVSLPFAGG